MMTVIAFRSDEAQKYLDHWQKLKTENPSNIPRWERFDPASVKTLLPHMVVHDLRTDGDSIIRLMGTDIEYRWGRDLTGKSYLNIVPEVRRKAALTYLIQMAEQPCGMRVLVRSEGLNGRNAYAEAFGLPFQPRQNEQGKEQPQRPFLAFINIPINDENPIKSGNHQSQFNQIIRRDFIDIGFGVPNTKNKP